MQCRLIEHRSFAKKLCRTKPLTEEAREQYMQRAMENDDALMMVLLILERRINVDGMEFPE